MYYYYQVIAARCLLDGTADVNGAMVDSTWYTNTVNKSKACDMKEPAGYWGPRNRCISPGILIPGFLEKRGRHKYNK